MVGASVLTPCKSVERLEYNGQAVVTIRQIAEVHGQEEKDIRRALQRNKAHFIEDDDYVLITGLKRQKAAFEVPNRGLTVFTEHGYLKLVKTFGDDLAWKIQGQLIDCYFHRKAEATAVVPVPQSAADHLALLRSVFMVANDEHVNMPVSGDRGSVKGKV